jgi:TM2 domain-containing membrane protein YozV
MDPSESAPSESGMPTIGYVAITLGVLGALMTFSVYGTAFAIILALPSVILCRKAHRIYKSRFQKANGALVALLVLNWIGTIVSGLFIATAGCLLIYFYGFQNRQATAGAVSNTVLQSAPAALQFRTTSERMWARGLNASGAELSPADVSQVELLYKQLSAMASAEGQFMKAWGTGVGSQDVFKRDAPGLLQAWTSGLATGKYYQAGVTDPGAKSFLGTLLEAESGVCDGYRQLLQPVDNQPCPRLAD